MTLKNFKESNHLLSELYFLRRETKRKNVYLSKHLWKISNKEIMKKTQIADKSCKAIDYSKRSDGILIGI